MRKKPRPGELCVGCKTMKGLRDMSLFDLFRRKSATNTPKIRTRKDLIAFLKETTGDDKLALFLVKVLQKIGRCGHIEVKQGGSGHPYAAEYPGQDGWKGDDLRLDAAEAEIKSLREAIDTATSDDERASLKRRLAIVAGATCTIWINVMLSADFEKQRRLIMDSMRKLRDALHASN